MADDSKDCKGKGKRKLSMYLFKLDDRRYQYRRRIPPKIKWVYDLREIRVSLLTNNLRAAEKRSSTINERVEQIFTDAYRGLITSPTEAKAAMKAALVLGQPESHEKTLEQLGKEYELSKGQSWDQKGRQEYWKAVNTFIELIGNRPVRFIDRDMVIELREKIRATGVKPRTVNKYLTRLSSLFRYATVTSAVKQNPCIEVKYAISEADINANKYLPYTDEEVKWILEEMLVHSGEEEYHSYKYWLPLLDAFCGARLGDVADLRKEDFGMREELQCVTLGNRKTGAMPRTIPLHSKLIELGIMNFVDSLKPGEALFDVPLHYKNGKPKHDYKWYMRELRKNIQDKRKAFHSWRSTVSSRLNDKSVNVTHRADILGHESKKKGITTDEIYTSMTDVRTLKVAIELLQYPTVDWSKVRDSANFKEVVPVIDPNLGALPVRILDIDRSGESSGSEGAVGS